MPCYRPLSAYLTRDVHPTGGRVISFSKHGTFYDRDEAISLPCGKCIGCRLERSRQWAVRLMHERQMHELASFITLTYDNEHLPAHGSLCKKDTRDFMKRLRFWHSDYFQTGGGLRFFLAGEYGEKHGRPHYHLILFGEDFSFDRVRVEDSFSGSPQFESPDLTRLWGKGRVVIGDVTFESCAYVARYCLKKVNNEEAYIDKKGVRRPGKAEHYAGREPEFATMSRRPGIGEGWFKKFGGDVFPSDQVVVRGRACKPPRRYDEYLKAASEREYTKLKNERARKAGDPLSDDNWEESSPARLEVKEICKQAQLKQCERKV